MSLTVLFIGGTGQISLPAVEESVAAGHKVSVFNRGKTAVKLPADVTTIVGDMTDDKTYGELGRRHFDVVCQFMAFTPDQIERDVGVFAGQTGQYIFISSASAYQKPARHYIITERTPLENPYWEYSRRKAACEQVLRGQNRVPFTIVRPSHTVRTRLPTAFSEGDGLAHRMLRQRPVIVPGDGTSLWTVTRSIDICRPFVKLFGNEKALGEDFHITADRAHTWDQIYAAIADALEIAIEIVHVPTDTLIRYRQDFEGGLLGDRSWSAVFDNSKVKSVAGPFTCAEDLREILAEPVAHFKMRLADEDPPVGELDPLFDRIVEEQGALGRD